MRFRFACSTEIEPFHLRFLAFRSEDFDLVATLEFIADRHKTMVDLRSDAVRTNVGVEVEGEVECSRASGHLADVAFRGKYEYLSSIEVEFKSIHELDSIGEVACVEHLLDGLEPLVEVGLFLFACFVFPVSSQALFGDIVHTLATDLHLNPVATRTHNSDVESLIAIRLRSVDPVASAVGVRSVDACNGRISHPAISLFVFGWFRL